MVEPQPGRRAAKQIIVLGKAPPDRPAVGLDRRAVEGRHAEILQPHALAEQHAEDVVVGHDEQLRRIRERLVQRIPARIGVAVRADDRQVLDAGIEVAGERARMRFGGNSRSGSVSATMGKRLLPVWIPVRSAEIEVNCAVGKRASLRQAQTGVTPPVIRSPLEPGMMMTSKPSFRRHASEAARRDQNPRL